MNNTKELLIDCFTAVFPNLGREEIPNATMASVGEWDSLASINLIAVIQEEFAVEIKPEEYESITSFDLILDLLKRNVTGSRGHD